MKAANNTPAPKPSPRRELPFLAAPIAVTSGFEMDVNLGLEETDGGVGSSSIMQRHICYLAVGHDSRRRYRAPRHTHNYKQCWGCERANSDISDFAMDVDVIVGSV